MMDGDTGGLLVRLKPIVAICLLPMISACFVSEQPLFNASQGVRPIANGTYAAPGSRMSFTSLGTRQYAAVNDGKRSVMTLVPVADRAGLYLVQQSDGARVYYTAARTHGSGFDLLDISCARDLDASWARELANQVGNNLCVFDDGDAVMTAIDMAATEAPSRRWTFYANATRAPSLAGGTARLAQNAVPTRVRSPAATIGGPSAAVIANLHASSHAKYFANVTKTDTPGTVAVVTPLMGVQMYHRYTVTNLGCIAASVGAYKCSYTLNADVIPANALVEIALVLQNKHTSYQWTAVTFVRGKSGWYSPIIDRTTASNANAGARDTANGETQAARDRDDRLKERQRAYDLCRSQNKYDLTSVCYY